VLVSPVLPSGHGGAMTLVVVWCWQLLILIVCQSIWVAKYAARIQPF